MVFAHEIDPSFKDQKVLKEIHNQIPFPPDTKCENGNNEQTNKTHPAAFSLITDTNKTHPAAFSLITDINNTRIMC